MKTATAEIRLNGIEPCRIFFTGDWHVGNCNFDLEAARNLVGIILDSKRNVPNTYVITMGDLFDLIVHSDSKRFMPATIDHSYMLSDLSDMPNRQMDDAQEIFGPIMPLVIAKLTGNHEAEYKKRHHVDIHDMFFKRFPLPHGVTYIHGDGDLGYIGFLWLRFKTTATQVHAVDFCLNHGDGGGGYREGYPKNKVHDVFRWSEADYAIMGHIHQLETDYKDHHYMDIAHHHAMRTRWKGISGTLLRTAVEGKANYFEHKGRPGGSIGCLMAEMSFYERQISGARNMIRDLRLDEIRLDMPKWKYRRAG